MGVVRTSSIAASGGASDSIVATNRSIASADPSTSTKTPRSSLPTKPVSASRRATLFTNGRKPTPCTTPRISIRTRTGCVRVTVCWPGVSAMPHR